MRKRDYEKLRRADDELIAQAKPVDYADAAQLVTAMRVSLQERPLLHLAAAILRREQEKLPDYEIVG